MKKNGGNIEFSDLWDKNIILMYTFVHVGIKKITVC